MQVTGFVPSFSMSTFAQSISSPYTSFKAYQAGAIDANGNLLKPETSIDDYEYFIIKLKKIFEEIPTSYTKSRLGSYSSTFQLFTEEAKKYGLNKVEFLYFLEGYAISQKYIKEDMGVGAVGGGGGGIGTPIPYENKGEVAGYDPLLGAPMFKRAGNVEMFDVSPEEFSQFKIHKAWKHLPDSETKRYLQRFQRRNKESKMAVRSLNKDNGKYDVHWINMKPISFMEEFNLLDLPILQENIKTSKSGKTAADVVGQIASQIGVQKDYGLESLNSAQTEYVGRMVDWVNGFHAASLSGEEGHAEEWIQLGVKNANKKASSNDSAGPEADPDGFRYDATAKSKQFRDRVVKVDYGTDRKPVAQLSGKRKGIVLGGEMIPLPQEGPKFKESVRGLIADPSMEKLFRNEMEKSIDMPQTIAHTRTTGPRLPRTSTGFVSHEPEQLKQIVQSGKYNINPKVGKPTTDEPWGRKTVDSLDLRVRSKSSPTVDGEMGYDEIRSIPGGDEPKEAISVSQDALDHLIDNIPDGPNKDSLVHHVSSIVGPHLARGRYPLRLPSTKVIST